MNLKTAHKKLGALANGAYCEVSVSIRGGGTSSYSDAPVRTYTEVRLYIEGSANATSEHSYQDAFDKLEQELTRGPKEDLAATETSFDEAVEF